MNVLSIDFDFFQDATAKQLKQYPDGVDYGTEMSKIVWSSYYTDLSMKRLDLNSITINQDFFDQMIEIIQNQDFCIPVLITNSHKYIYDFIMEHWDKNEDIEIWNVDMHHDVFNNNPQLDCGNWGKHIIDDANATLHWIGRTMSIEAYGLGCIKDFPMEDNFDSIRCQQFDALFLCRSDPWLPPHLDDKFTDMANECCDHFIKVLGEPKVMIPRDISEWVKSFEEANDIMCHELSMLQKGRDHEENDKKTDCESGSPCSNSKLCTD